MIKKLVLRNFRGIANAEVSIAPVTVLTGANNSGKSSVMYGLLTLKNILSNPNQPLDSFFNFIFMNLGGFKETIHLKEEEKKRITIGIHCEDGDVKSSYHASLGKAQSTLEVEEQTPAKLSLKLDVTFPYSLNLSTGVEADGLKLTWNGISPTVTAKEAGQEERATLVASGILLPVSDIKGVDFVPLKRGFIKPIFSPVPVQQQLISEDEVATLVANDRDLEGKINYWLERIVNRNFHARPTLGTANFYLQTNDRDTGFVCDLVNEGFGTNQLVYLLAKALRKDQTTICIEEPEIHLNPAAVLRLVDVLVEVAKDLNRSFVISTHSEHIVVALLTKLAQGAIKANDLRVYHIRKEKARSVIEEQRVNEKGQIEGGLKAFYDTELQQMRDFLSVTEEA